MVLLLPLLLLANPPRAPETPIVCDHCEAWNRPHAPFKVVGNTYYVGREGLSAVLIDTGKGLILLDGALPQSAPVIEANLKSLGFRIQDVKLIVNSHAPGLTRT
jgi:metallo-beta-lactamase class B